jgi:hypothetical protein
VNSSIYGRECGGCLHSKCENCYNYGGGGGSSSNYQTSGQPKSSADTPNTKLPESSATPSTSRFASETTDHSDASSISQAYSDTTERTNPSPRSSLSPQSSTSSFSKLEGMEDVTSSSNVLNKTQNQSVAQKPATPSYENILYLNCQARGW